MKKKKFFFNSKLSGKHINFGINSSLLSYMKRAISSPEISVLPVLQSAKDNIFFKNFQNLFLL